jgi:hypothetical protein
MPSDTREDRRVAKEPTQELPKGGHCTSRMLPTTSLTWLAFQPGRCNTALPPGLPFSQPNNLLCHGLEAFYAARGNSHQPGTLFIIIEQMAKKPHKKSYEKSAASSVTDLPTLHETKEKSKIKSILKKLIHIKKGH